MLLSTYSFYISTCKQQLNLTHCTHSGNQDPVTNTRCRYKTIRTVRTPSVAPLCFVFISQVTDMWLIYNAASVLGSDINVAWMNSLLILSIFIKLHSIYFSTDFRWHSYQLGVWCTAAEAWHGWIWSYCPERQNRKLEHCKKSCFPRKPPNGSGNEPVFTLYRITQ